MHRISVWKRQGREGRREGGMHRGWAPGRQAEVCLWSRQHVLPRDAGPRQHLQLLAAAPRPARVLTKHSRAAPRVTPSPWGGSFAPQLFPSGFARSDFFIIIFLPAPVLSIWLLLQRSPRTGGGYRLWHWEIWQQKWMLLNIRDLLKKKEKMPFKGLGSLKERFFNPGKEEVKNIINDSLGNLRR